MKNLAIKKAVLFKKSGLEVVFNPNHFVTELIEIWGF